MFVLILAIQFCKRRLECLTKRLSQLLYLKYLQVCESEETVSVASVEGLVIEPFNQQ